MKKTTLILLFLTLVSSAFSQQHDAPKKDGTKQSYKRKSHSGCPVFYITTSTGINNNTGLIGVSVDVPVAKYISIDGGAGLSSWGSKLYLGGKYYLKPCQRGWAFGTGFTYNTGIQNYQSDMETIYGNTETVQLNLHPQANILIAAYRYWNLGHRANRLYLELGWSVPVLGGDKFEQTAGDQISSTSVTTLNLISPGGLVVGFGFSFGIYK